MMMMKKSKIMSKIPPESCLPPVYFGCRGATRWLNSSIAPHLLDDEDGDDGDDDGEDVDYQDDKDESSPKSGESFCYLTSAQYLARSCLGGGTWLDDTYLAEKNVLQK